MNRFTESFLAARLGGLGAWAARILTVGCYRPDPESWVAVAIGFVVLTVLLITCEKL